MMMMIHKRVRAGYCYVFQPVWFDQANPPFDAQPGDIVRVVNLPGCPRAGTMGMCHIERREDTGWKFAGMVCTNSLRDLKDYKLTNKQCGNPLKSR